ncbi:MAG: Glycine dehydrogenase (decarboxylating) [Planctomycetes bacterium]|nr:Glycine dehydrogenase (decarboxylating) [Planctomycetota bacterium]
MSANHAPLRALAPTDTFERRHTGPDAAEQKAMLEFLGCGTLDELTDQTVPASIRTAAVRYPSMPEGKGENEALVELRALASRNRVLRSWIGMGYHGTIVPGVIQRNILENPGWYTQYTPYQAEISQGRMEALLNYQTLVADLTALPVANASLLDEATAAAEAMSLCLSVAGGPGSKGAAGKCFFVADDCHPQTIEVVRTRAKPLGIEVVVGDPMHADFRAKPAFGALVQNPNTYGEVRCYEAFGRRVRESGGLLCMATDLLFLTLSEAPGEIGADVAIGSAQRFGVPMGFGGPHAAFFATKDQHKREIAGRLIGVSRDSRGKPAMRLTLATREQHIRREKATSNICTAQVLLAVMASMYAVYHGPDGLKAIATRVHDATRTLAGVLRGMGHEIVSQWWFDTLHVRLHGGKGGAADAATLRRQAEALGINLRYLADGTVCVALDETVTEKDVRDLAAAFGDGKTCRADLAAALAATPQGFDPSFDRRSAVLTHPVFHRHRSETEMLRYIRRLEGRDLSLCHSMIPLGSCTMKLNATSEMFPVTWPEFGALHPFAPRDQAAGYMEMFRRLEAMLCEVTGFAGCSLQPNAGSQGEYAGLLTIRTFHESRGEAHRNICLIPSSAHGTNPASAVMAGMKVVVVACDASGNIDLADLRAKAEKHAKDLACVMVTYPSTHGVFEEGIRDLCRIVHEHGGQVYMDGANFNAQLGLCKPGDFGADVCHLNLHKTFCIPHGGGGPGMGPICCAPQLVPHLPGHRTGGLGGEKSSGAVSAAPWGSASILVISYMYCAMMGAEALRRATQVAILNANYMAKRLSAHYPILYTGSNGRVAHEFILDYRPVAAASGVTVEDVAKRLMDYGFHAPTMSFPVAGTLMIEPTESECRAELDRLCDALIAIRAEIARVESGEWPKDDNPLHNAPHTMDQVVADGWKHPYSRDVAAFPAPWVRERKFWPHVSRVDNVFGDRNVVCTCPPTDSYAS